MLKLFFVDYTTEAEVNLRNAIILSLDKDLNFDEDAYKELENNHKLPGIKEAVDSFTEAIIEYNDTVLKDLVAASIASVGDNSGKIRKSTEWGSKKPWKKTAVSVGASSKMSAVSEDADGVVQAFVDDDAEQVNFADEVEIEKPGPMEVPKKKKTVKRVVRRVRKQPDTVSSDTAVDSKLDDSAMSALRPVAYYMSDRYAGMSKGLQDAVDRDVRV